MGQSNMFNVSVHGLEDVFAQEWAKQLNKAKPTVIQCAVSGTPLRDWYPGRAYFDQCAEMTKNYSVLMVAWYQGETDAGQCYDDYMRGQFELIMNAFRGEAGWQVPVVYAQLANHVDYRPCWDQVKAAQANIKLSKSAMVETASWAVLENDSDTGLPSVHLDAASHRELAKRMISAVRGIL